jgi:hypothetical protein
MSSLLPSVAFAAGIVTHLLYYKQYEFHVNPLRNVQTLFLAGATAVIVRLSDRHWHSQRPTLVFSLLAYSFPC